MTDNEPRTLKINVSRWEAALDRLASLNKTAARLGCPAARLTILSVKDEPIYATDCEGRTLHPERIIGVRRFNICTVEGESAKFAGWTLGACVENTDGGNILRKSPMFKGELDPRFRTCASGCEHCNTKRNRKETFVVVHENGDQKLVGRDCIRDFLGHQSPENMLARFQWTLSLEGAFDEFESDGYGYGSDSTLTTTDAMLAYSACATRVYGFISSTRAREYNEAGGNLESTAGTASRWMSPPPKNMTEKERAERQTPSEVDDARASAARQYVLDTLVAKAGLTDFESNLLVACRAEYADRKNIGLLAFVVEYHARETEKSLARQREAAIVRVHYPAAEKSRISGIKLVYVRSIGYESQFGAGFFHIFNAGENNQHLLKWSTGTAMEDTTPGKEYVATLTIKRHTEFNGMPQTEINRVKFTA